MQRRNAIIHALVCSLVLGFVLGTCMFATPTSVHAQGVLIVDDPEHPMRLPRPVIRPDRQPPASYKIKELSVQARIEDQVARTQVTQSFVNTGSRQMEVCFVFPLPYDGAIDRLTFMVDGHEYEAKLLPKDEARRIYEGYIRRNQDPALLEWIGRGMFKTSVFPVPPGAERKVTLRYSQLLRKDTKLTDYLFPLSTAKYSSKPIEKLNFEVSIASQGKIKSVYSPSHTVDIERSDERHARVKFSAENAIPISDFRLFYDTAEETVGASVISFWPQGADQGFFLLLTSPQIERPTVEQPRKTVIVVVDRSGSMSGKKIEQAREAMKFVVNNLRENDLFNIVAYDSEVETFRPELQKFNEESRQAAIGFAEGIFAGGSTNINDALITALDMVQDESQPSYIVFLTDGRPTAGETQELKIVDNTRSHNLHRTRVINMGVGFDVNSRLLDRLSRTHHGQSEFVRPDEDLETHVARLYRRISSPVLSGVEVAFEFDEVQVEQGSVVNRLYPRQTPDIFQGEQLILAGRYRKSGTSKISLTGRIGQAEKKFVFAADFAGPSDSENYAFVERLWAKRRIGEIIDELDLKGHNEELVKELVHLSMKHGILTPYTSFLADDQAPNQLAVRNFGLREANESLDMLSEAEGRRGFLQRANKSELQRADQSDSSGLVMPTTAANRPSSAGGAGGGQGGYPGADAYRLRGGGGFGVANNVQLQTFADGDSLSGELTDNVQVVGNEALYYRAGLWFAANLGDFDYEKNKDQVQVIERYSPEYFELVAKNSPAENTILAQQNENAELIIRLRDEVYHIK